MKLSRTQQELYDAMKAGVICYYMPYMGRFRPNPYYFRSDTHPYYFRSDTHKHCTATAAALLKKGLAERFDQEPYNGGHKLRIRP